MRSTTRSTAIFGVWALVTALTPRTSAAGADCRNSCLTPTAPVIEALSFTSRGSTSGQSDRCSYNSQNCRLPTAKFIGPEEVYKVILHKGNNVRFALSFPKDKCHLTLVLTKECSCESHSPGNFSASLEILEGSFDEGTYYLYVDSVFPGPCPSYTLTATGINPVPDLKLDLKAPGSIAAGEDLTYTLTVSNNGELAATGVQVVLPLPAGVNYKRSDGCKLKANQVVCTIDRIGIREFPPPSRTVTVTVDPAIRHRLTTEATATANEADPTLNKAPAFTQVRGESDLSITHTSPATSVAGLSTTYTLTLRNDGPSDATKVVVTDSLPSDFLSASGAGCLMQDRQVVCKVKGLKAKASTTLSLTAGVKPSAEGSISHGVDIAATERDPNSTTNNRTTITTRAIRQTNLTLSRTGSIPSKRAAGETVAYELRVENKGPSNSRGASVSNTLPPGLMFDSSEDGCTPTSPGTVTCEIGPLQAGAGKPVSFVARIGSGVEPQTLSNVATVVAKDEDLVTTDNVATIKTDVYVEADMRAQILKVERLSWTLPSTSGDVKAGESLLYTVRTANNGPSDSRGGGMEVTLPAGLAFISSPDGCSVADRTCSVPALKKGEEAVRRFVAGIAPSKSGSTGSKVCINSRIAEHDPQGGNNCAEDTSTRIGTEADLSVALSDSPDAVHPEEDLTYTVSVKNEGPSNASSVTVDLEGSPIEFGDVKAGFVKSRTVTVVAPDKHGVVTARAELDTPDQNDTNNSAETSTTVATQDDVDLAVSLSVDAEAAVAGRPLTFQLTLANQGFSASGETDVSVDFSQAVTVSFEPLGPGASQTRTLTVDVGSVDSLLATADILQTDVNPANNHSSIEIPVVQTTEETDLCANWSVRFLRGQPAGTSTSLRFVVPRKLGYKPGDVVPMVAIGRVFTETGDFVQTVSVPFSGTEVFQVPTLSLLAGSGSIEWTFKEGYVGNVSSVHTKDGATTTIPGFCRRPGHAGAKALVLPSFQVDSTVNTYIAIRNETDEQVDVRITYSSEPKEPRQQVLKIAGHGVSTVNLRQELGPWTGSLEVEAFRDGKAVEALSGDFLQVGPPNGLIGSALD